MVMHQKANVHLDSDQVLINLSLGMDIESSTYNVLDEKVVAAVNAGSVVVVAAGNNSVDAATYSPAHPGATPAQVAAGLVLSAHDEISGTWPGTMNRAVSLKFHDD
ncbi:MAG: subtilisin family serine protease [Rhodothermales bacterium]|jgi:subtilisin family serine protease